MNEPLKKGDLAEIVAGALGDKGPNVGKRVTVGDALGEHSKFGRIVRVHGSGLVSEYGASGDSVDCAVAWLRKLPPPPQQLQRTADKLEA